MEVLQQALVALFQDRQLAQTVLEPLPEIALVLGAVDRQCIAQVIGQTDVVHDVAAVLVAADAIDARDGLQQIVLAQLLRSEEHTSELQSLMRISYAVFCLKKKNNYKIVAES